MGVGGDTYKPNKWVVGGGGMSRIGGVGWGFIELNKQILDSNFMFLQEKIRILLIYLENTEISCHVFDLEWIPLVEYIRFPISYFHYINSI